MSESTVFDQIATDYDVAFSDRTPAIWLRQQVRVRVEPHLPSNGCVLDLGCGTGDDALWLAENGYSVVAADVSQGMLDRAQAKRDSAPREVRERISLVSVVGACSSLPSGPFDAVWSNFGALNCVSEIGSALDAIADRLRPNGIAALVVMGRFCLWETLGFALRGEFRRAFRRWKGRASYSAGGIVQDVRYHAPSAIRRAATQFEVVDLAGIGVFVPSTEFFAVCERRPALLTRLGVLETRFAGYWPFNRLGDHYLIVLRGTS